MNYEVVTIGDAMKDNFLFPALSEMRKPIDGDIISSKEKGEKFLIFPFGGKVTISEIYNDIGGTACNVAVGLSRLKVKTALVSAIGQDFEGQEVKQKLKKETVDLANLKIYLSRKTSFSIIISFKGERTILVRHNFEPDDFVLPKNINTKWIYVGPLGEDYKHLYDKIISLAAQKDINIAINPGSVQINDGLNSFGALLKIAKIIFLNREEAQILTGLRGATTVKDLSIVLKKTGIETVVITDGDNGSYVNYENGFLKVGVYPSRRVESTGAGDAFASGFLAAYLKNKEMLECLKWGVTNGAFVVGKYGAQQGLLSARAIETKVKEYRWPADGLRFS